MKVHVLMGLVFMGQVFSGCCMNLLFSRQNQKTKSLLCFPMDFFADLVFKGQGLYLCIQKYIEVFLVKPICFTI